MKKILLIEDNNDLREMYKLRLEKEGYTVFEAKNGEEGVYKALEEKPDLVLLDILMPAKGGLGVLGDLKNLPETKEIPIIILSVLDKADYKEEATRFGALYYLTKSEVTPDEVIQRIKDVLRENS